LIQFQGNMGQAAIQAAQRTQSLNPPRLSFAVRLDRVRNMNVTLEIPDDVAERLTAAGDDLSRRALEALVLEEYKRGRLTKPEASRLLGFETRAELEAFFKAHKAFGM
jgi:hypothetical protein